MHDQIVKNNVTKKKIMLVAGYGES